MFNLSSFFLGCLLSFLGQLPLGTMSLTATQIAVQENFRSAWKYALGVAFVEMIYLYGVLTGMRWIMFHRKIFVIFNWLTVVLFLFLGLLGFITARKQKEARKALILNNQLDRFFLGLTMSALNPAQIPFWFVWSAYFLDSGWLRPGYASFNWFTLGSGLGTIGGLVVYMYGGNWLVVKMKTSNRTLNTIMGIVFMLAALAQSFRLLRS
jgi:threonine/homoserine/homoserine lactone efflux protein